MELAENTNKLQNFTQSLAGEALKAFDQNLIDEGSAREWILANLHPEGPACPWCGKEVTGERACSRWWAGHGLRCRVCGSKFSGRSKTALAKIRLSFSEAMAFLILVELGLSVPEIARRMGLRLRTAYEYKNRFFEEVPK